MIVTLLTDFGTRDHFVAAMKGVILGLQRDITLVDITHEIPPHDIEEAAFTLAATWASFPPGTLHLAVVDPGVGSARRPMAASADGHLLVGPDNGLFWPILRAAPGSEVREIANPALSRPDASATFHGRDLFAPAAAALAGGLTLEAVGPVVADPVRLPRWEVVAGPRGTREGRVVHVDRFGNLITSFTRADLPADPGRPMRLEVDGQAIEEVRPFYAAGPVAVPFAIWGSAGYLEVSVREGSAAAWLGVGRGAPVTAAPS